MESSRPFGVKSIRQKLKVNNVQKLKIILLHSVMQCSCRNKLM